MDLDFVAVSLIALVKQSIRRYGQRGESKRQTFDADYPARPLIVWADALQVCQILDQLISQTIESSPCGATIRVRLGCHKTDAIVAIWSTTRFNPANGGGNRLDIERVPGLDNVCLVDEKQLSLTFPLATPEQASGAHRAWRVLVADDSRVNQALVHRLLQKEGHEVTVVSDGQEALEALAEQDFDLVLMDAEMPRVDGPEAVRRIRESTTKQRYLPIIGMSASNAESWSGSYVEGIDEELPKPITLETLKRAIECGCGWKGARNSK